MSQHSESGDKPSHVDFDIAEVVPRYVSEAPPTRNCLHTLGPPVKPPPDSRLGGVVLVDMDNTLNDWDAQFNRLMKNFYPSVPLIPPEMRVNYQMELNYPDHVREAILRQTDLRGFWAMMPIAKHAQAALGEMQAAGLQVFVVSKPDHRFTGRCAAEKFEWLEANFGPQWKSRLILSADKTLINGDILIDDNPCVTGARDPPWTHVKFCQPYNMKLDVPCLHSWDRWYEALQPLLRRRGG